MASPLLLASLRCQFDELFEQPPHAATPLSAQAVVCSCAQPHANSNAVQPQRSGPLCDAVTADVDTLKVLGVTAGSYVRVHHGGASRVGRLVLRSADGGSLSPQPTCSTCRHAFGAARGSLKATSAAAGAPVLCIPPMLAYNLGLPYTVQPALLAGGNPAPAPPLNALAYLVRLSPIPPSSPGTATALRPSTFAVAKHVTIARLAAPAAGPLIAPASDASAAPQPPELAALAAPSSSNNAGGPAGLAAAALQAYFSKGPRLLALGDVFAVAAAAAADESYSPPGTTLDAGDSAGARRLLFFRVVSLRPGSDGPTVVEAGTTEIVMAGGHCRALAPVGWESSILAPLAVLPAGTLASLARHSGTPQQNLLLGRHADAALCEPAHLPGERSRTVAWHAVPSGCCFPIRLLLLAELHVMVVD